MALTIGGTDNNNLHPEPDCDLDIFASTSLKNSSEKDILLRNIGYLRGVRVDNNDGPQTLTRQVAKYAGQEPPLVQEINDFVTESITTKTEREANYIHSGWSLDAVSAINPWISSRIAFNNQPNAEGTWITRRTLIHRFRLRISPGELTPVPEFRTEVEAALNRLTVFQQFEAVYQALHKWGDVVPLEVEMGASLVFTDFETNVSQLPATASWFDTRYLATIRTARITRQGAVDDEGWEDSIWPKKTIPPLQWHQTRIRKVIHTIRLLPVEIQDRLSQLYSQRLSYIPALIIGPSDSSCQTHDDTHHAANTISSVTIYTSDFIRTVKFDYADTSKSSKHEGSESQGSEHNMVLIDGEYITEIFIWKHDWIDGLQFITNFGRCSPHFGGLWGVPTVARSKGGVLVGIISLIQQHSFGRLFRNFQGIWRHDAVDRVPKEEDVFSIYFGSHHGKPFNDRVVVRNSNMAILKINVGCGAYFDSLQLTYLDNSGREVQTDRHGGAGGGKHEFVLEPGEHITSVSGKYDDQHITQMTFITDQGRSSGSFGEGYSTGKLHSFSVSSPKDRDGKRMRLQYACGKSDASLNGIMLVWTPV
ncbi:hypothetical protein RSOLAG22IIIB_07994 [Rhizoctonia solani]|uniref:Jacalin-type lectin domain-containing protein n=1 Tax=Rhizoctonia solani TaxID=456999 RepID=A0A0K6FQZ5_9AGAM|nr:hypothetical protein RSOLAG22IIIB_07994 [Rhizoctonia solani]